MSPGARRRRAAKRRKAGKTRAERLARSETRRAHAEVTRVSVFDSIERSIAETPPRHAMSSAISQSTIARLFGQLGLDFPPERRDDRVDAIGYAMEHLRESEHANEQLQAAGVREFLRGNPQRDRSK